jgi:hypothetical protein
MPTLEAQDGRITTMGFLDERKDKAEEFGDKAKEGFEAAKDKTEDVIENVKDSFDSDDTPAEKAGQRDAAAAASDAGQDVGDFAPVGATEPEVAAVEDATAGAAEQSHLRHGKRVRNCRLGGHQPGRRRLRTCGRHRTRGSGCRRCHSRGSGGNLQYGRRDSDQVHDNNGSGHS